MWRKTADGKNPSQSSNIPEPVATAPKAGQNLPAQAIPAGPSPIAQTATPAPTPTSAASYSSPATAGNPFAAAPRASSVSVIGAGLKIQGEITGDSDLVVEGEAHGRIRMVNGRVTVAASGRVNADIEAVEISVEGSVQGGLKASDRVRLGPSSRVQGSVITPRIAIEDGARLRGKVEMIRVGEVAGPVTKTSVATNAISSTPVAATPVAKAPLPTTPASNSATTPGATENTGANTAKASDATTPAITTEADRLKATAARGSGD
jgi:cytoskeletal protein CcmA (bactofilin family)